MAKKIEAKNEPVTIGAAIVAVFAAVGPALVAFGVDLTPEQIASANGAVLAILGLVTAIVRSKVTPVGKATQPEVGNPAAKPAEDQAAQLDGRQFGKDVAAADKRLREH